MVASLFAWLGHVIASMFPWPFVALVVLFYLTRSPFAATRIGRLFQRIGLKKVDIAGSGFELSEQKRQEITVVAEDVLDVVSAYGEQLNRELARLADQGGFLERIATYVGGVIADVDRPAGLRCTIHVADPLLRSYLNQLIDYYPSGPEKTAGRRFSCRFGIIGRAWRTGEPYLVGRYLPEGAPPISGDPKTPRFQVELRKYMADNWGMTSAEAERARHKPSYLALPITFGKDKVPVGLLFMDAEVEDAFGSSSDKTAALKRFRDALDASDIPATLASLRSDIAKYAAALDLEKVASA